MSRDAAILGRLRLVLGLSWRGSRRFSRCSGRWRRAGIGMRRRSILWSWLAVAVRLLGVSKW